MVATAHLGRGRVVAFAHDGYFGDETLKVADTAKLLWNAIHWAGADKPKPRVGLIDGPALRAIIEEHGGTAERTKLDGNPRGFDVLVLVPVSCHFQPGEAAPGVRRIRRWPARGGDRLGLAAREQEADGRIPRELALSPGRVWPGPTDLPSGPRQTVIEPEERSRRIVNAASALKLSARRSQGRTQRPGKRPREHSPDASHVAGPRSPISRGDTPSCSRA